MIRRLAAFVHGTLTDFVMDRATQFAAALSFYAAFSMAPLVVMVLTLMAQILDGPQARDYVIGQIALQLGPAVADTVSGMIGRVTLNQPRGAAAALATAAMVIGATAVIMSMKGALDHVFGRIDHTRARDLWLGILVARFKSFAMVLLLSVLLGLSLLATAVSGGLISAIGERLPDWVDLAGWSNTAFAFFVLWLLVFICYRFFPDRPPGWRAAFWGALIAALLFGAGKRAIGWYVGTVGTASAFGAAGALAVFLIWIYVNAMVFLLGAECAKNLDRI
ncbi:MAG: YihY/virulence factor BrkB family protein [Burkholderiaceae bacterium]